MTPPEELPSADWVATKTARRLREPIADRIARRLFVVDEYVYQDESTDELNKLWDEFVTSTSRYEREVADAYRDLAHAAIDELLPLLPASLFTSYAARRDQTIAAQASLIEQLQRQVRYVHDRYEAKLTASSNWVAAYQRQYEHANERRNVNYQRAERLAAELCGCTSTRCYDGTDDVSSPTYSVDCPACVDLPTGRQCYALERNQQHDSSANVR